MELNKAVLDCMQALRRRLREEFSVDIRLSQPDAVEAMLLACMRSSDKDTRQLGIQLAELSDVENDAAQGSPRQQYRGHVLANESVVPLVTTRTTEEPRGTVVRMYRGQRVYA